MLGSAESEKVTLISREIIFAKFQPIYNHDTSTLQTDGQIDGQLALAVPRSATLRAVKTVALAHTLPGPIAVIVYDSYLFAEINEFPLQKLKILITLVTPT